VILRIPNLGRRPGIVGIVGGNAADARTLALAEEMGAGIAGLGCVLVTGGGSGVMRSASKGAFLAGGLVVGILPNERSRDMQGYPNEYVHVPVYTGMSDARNAIIALTSEVIVALQGSFGTISEIALALKSGTPVISLCPAYDALGASPWYVSVETAGCPVSRRERSCKSLKLITKQ
jgi:uncharacterized protein (TIGR00725 family)